MPPPAPPSSSSSSAKKRKLADSEFESHDPSDAASSKPPSRVSSAFSVAVRNRVFELNGECCFHCGGEDFLHICPVIPSAKKALYNQGKQSGVFNFEHGGAENAVPLCTSCHYAFDGSDNPSLFFVPVDLEYFKTFENEDFDRRLASLRSSTPILKCRTCPTVHSYNKRLQDKGLLAPKSSGGLYWRYTLRKYSGLFPANFQFPSKAEDAGIWHGAPMAAMHHALQAVGGLWGGLLPKDLVSDLRELQDLYARDPRQYLAQQTALSGGGSQGHATVAIDHPQQSLAPPPYNPRQAKEGPRDAGANGKASEAPQHGQHGAYKRKHQDSYDTSSDSAIDVSSEEQAEKSSPAKRRKVEACPTLDHTTMESPLTTSHEPQEIWTWGPDSSSEEKAYWLSRFLAL